MSMSGYIALDVLEGSVNRELFVNFLKFSLVRLFSVLIDVAEANLVPAPSDEPLPWTLLRSCHG
jgi:hypothetical protein